jgi:hypothetical protein
MAVAIRTNGFPPGPGTDFYDAVTAAMDLENRPPDGLIFHWAGEVDGQWTISDVWESRSQFDHFQQERLLPAIQQVAGAAVSNGPQPTVSEFSVHNFVRP